MECPTILENVYKHFTKGNAEMNLRQYLKFAADCGFLDKKFSKFAVSSIYAKSTSKTEKRINFAKFKENFALFAAKKECSKNDIVRKIEAYGKKMFFPDPYAFVTTSESSGTSTRGSVSVSNGTTSDIPSMTGFSMTSV